MFILVVTGLGTKGTDIPFYDWSHYFINSHSHYRDKLLDPDSDFMTPQLMVFFNIEPQDISVLHYMVLLFVFLCYTMLL